MSIVLESPPPASKITLGRYVYIEREPAASSVASQTSTRIRKIDLLPWQTDMNLRELIDALTHAVQATQDPALQALQAAIDPAHRAEFNPSAVERLLAWPATARRVQIWRALLRVPFGETVSYGDLARQVTPPSGARAVGQTMNKNPFPLIVPCHRVLQTGGGLGGFGAGLDWKRALLTWEAQR